MRRRSRAALAQPGGSDRATQHRGHDEERQRDGQGRRGQGHQPPEGGDIREDGVGDPVDPGQAMAPAPGEAEPGGAAPVRRGGGQRQQAGDGQPAAPVSHGPAAAPGRRAGPARRRPAVGAARAAGRDAGGGESARPQLASALAAGQAAARRIQPRGSTATTSQRGGRLSRSASDRAMPRSGLGGREQGEPRGAEAGGFDQRLGPARADARLGIGEQPLGRGSALLHDPAQPGQEVLGRGDCGRRRPAARSAAQSTTVATAARSACATPPRCRCAACSGAAAKAVAASRAGPPSGRRAGTRPHPCRVWAAAGNRR